MERDMLISFLRALDGEDHVIEHMEKEGQQKAVNNIMLAKRMEPSIETWESLGFSFEDIPGDNLLCKATLPVGWSLRPTGHSMWTDIIDENGNLRGEMFYKSSFYDRDAFMRLKIRYSVRQESLDEERTLREVYFGNDEERLFVAGSVYFPKGLSRDELSKKYNELDRLSAITKKWAEENYPNWRSPLAYWDKPKKLIQKKDN